MRIQWKSKQSSEGCASPAGTTRAETGFTLAEVLVAVAILGFVAASLWAFAPGLGVIQCAGQNVRATQILMQKAEGLRLFTGREVCEPNKDHQPLFVEPHDPPSDINPGEGVQYAGYASAASPAPGSRPTACQAHMRPVLVTLCWTNYVGAKPIVHTREVQTRLARNGMPKYIWGAL